MKKVAVRRLRSGTANRRIVLVDGAWYFTTKQDIDVGPYARRKDAVDGAHTLYRLLLKATNSTEAIKTVLGFMILQKCDEGVSEPHGLIGGGAEQSERIRRQRR